LFINYGSKIVAFLKAAIVNSANAEHESVKRSLTKLNIMFENQYLKSPYPEYIISGNP